MPAPTIQLVRWFAIVVLPVSLLVVLHPAWLLVLGLVLLLFAFVALIDAMGGGKRLANVKLTFPPIFRSTQGRSAVLEVRVEGHQAISTPLRIGLPWPAMLIPEHPELPIPASSQGSFDVIRWSFTASRRGQWIMKSAQLGMGSRLGLWEHRRSVSVNLEIRSYPNLLKERRSLAGMFLHRGHVGTHAFRQIGKGREFEKLREYQPGDGFEDIHWKSTAKRGYPVTKVFQLERTQEVYVILDRSRLSGRPVKQNPEESGQATLLDRYLSAALVLGQAAESQGDHFGVIVFSEGIDRFVRAGSGTAHFDACRDALYLLEPGENSPDFDELASFLRTRLRKRALLIYLSSIDDPLMGEGFVRHAALVGRQHLLTLCMVRPPGSQPLFSNPEVESEEDLYQALGGHLRWQRLMEHGKELQRLGGSFHLVDTAGLSLEVVSRYLEIKQRQTL